MVDATRTKETVRKRFTQITADQVQQLILENPTAKLVKVGKPIPSGMPSPPGALCRCRRLCRPVARADHRCLPPGLDHPRHPMPPWAARHRLPLARPPGLPLARRPADGGSAAAADADGSAALRRRRRSTR